MESDKQKLKKEGRKRFFLLPYFALFAVLTATAGVTYLFHQSAKRIDELRFETNADLITARLEKLFNLEHLRLTSFRQALDKDLRLDSSFDIEATGLDSAGVIMVDQGDDPASRRNGLQMEFIRSADRNSPPIPVDKSSIDIEHLLDAGNTPRVKLVDLKSDSARQALFFYVSANGSDDTGPENSYPKPLAYLTVPKEKLATYLYKEPVDPKLKTNITIGKQQITLPSGMGQIGAQEAAGPSNNATFEAAGNKIYLNFTATEDFYDQSGISITAYLPIIGSLLGLLIFGLIRIEVKSRAKMVRFASDLDQARSENAALLESEKDARLHAEQSNRAKDEFMMTVSHEIRTPLNAISGWTRILEGNDINEATKSEALETINRNIKKQSEMINELLLFSSLRTKRELFDTRAVRVTQLVEEVAESISSEANEKNIGFSVSTNLSAEEVECDRKMIVTALKNLLGNAIKFTPPGGEVSFSANADADSVKLLIRDSGRGISDNFLPHVFDKFSQSDQSTTRRFGGLGLGLAIVKQIVVLHGGSIEVRSGGENTGAEFEVELPIAADDDKR